MLVFNEKSFTEDGVTVFADHANPNLFWYLPPSSPQIARRGPQDLPNFALNTFRPAVADNNSRGGGFLTIETELPLSDATERRIMSRLRSMAEDTPILSPAPLDSGTVKLVAVDLEGSGGTVNANTDGGLVFVEKIMGATKPSMAGDNNAVFNLQLTEEGAIFLKQVFENGSTNVGVVYDFEYSGLRPALDVEITTNFKRCYDHFSVNFGLDISGSYKALKLALKADIDRVFDKLVQDGTIEVKVINFSSAADAAEKEKWAFDFFKEKLLAEWFTPTFSAVTASASAPSIPSTPSTPATGNTTAATNTSSSSTTSTTPADASTTAATPAEQPAASTSSSSSSSTNASSSSSSSSSSSARATNATPVPAATVMSSPANTGPTERTESTHLSETLIVPRHIMSHRESFSVMETFAPATLTKSVRGGTTGRDVELIASEGSAQATLQFSGEGRPSRITVAERTLTLDGAGRVSFDVTPGQSVSFTARYPAVTASTDTFRLMFDNDKPVVAGFSANPPSTLYNAYLSGSSSTRDTAFLATRGSGTERNAAALRAWVAQSSSPIAINAHASFEGDTSKVDWNQRLTERRLAVAEGIIGNSAPISSTTAHGFAEARGANRLRNPADRVAILTREVAGGSETVIEGTVTRPGNTATPAGDTPATPSGDTPATPAETPTTPAETPSTNGGPRNNGGGGGTPAGDGDDDNPLISMPFEAKLSFALKSVTQIEDKSLTLKYNRQEAIKRSHAPQGPLFVMAEGLSGPPFFTDVDLDSAFFRKLEVEVDGPTDYEAIGLLATDVELEYGDPSTPNEIRRHDIRFRKDGESTTHHSFFLNEDLDLDYRVRNEFHFDAASGWEGSALSYDAGVQTTTDRTLMVNPYEALDFLKVTVLPGEMDAEMLRHTTVRLTYEGANWSREKVFMVTHESAATEWKLRLDTDDPKTYSYHLTHDFIANYDPSRAQQLFVQVTYLDPANTYDREETLTFNNTDLSPQKLRFARFNTDLDEFTYQITAMAADHSVTRFAPITTTDRIVFLGEQLNEET